VFVCGFTISMDTDQRPLAICLMGPTASGKTAIALALHELFPVEIISVDASQIYRGMDIGTAKPTAAEQARAPHRLIDIRDPAESYSAAQFRADALREMRDITARGRIPLLVGGTMFYFRALEYGLSALPAATPAIRRQISEQARQNGWPALHARLTVVDSETARRLDPHDAQRIQRALEIHALTGHPASALMRMVTPEPAGYRFHKIGLWPEDRAELHARIAARFNAMLERGLLQEVEKLHRRRDLDVSLPSMRTVGYREVWSYLTERVNYNEMVDRVVAATRQLAKRQLTWLRRYPDLERVDWSRALPMREVVARVRHVTIDEQATR
jgi:tRNA dimethylallyltransferase